MKTKYYALNVSDDEAELYIFGDITSYPWDEKDKDAYSIVKELEEITAQKINVHINSCGGSVSEGLAIYNTLKNNRAKVVTYCDGFACSAASVVFMAGDKRVMNSASLIMVHNPWTYGTGNAKELRKQADDLEKIAEASVNAYMHRVNITEDEVRCLLDEETWLTADEALEKGFATEIMEQEKEGISQSAFAAIRKKILTVPGESAEAELDTDAVADEIAGKVIGRLQPYLKEQATGQEDSTGFSAFFNNKKEIKR